MSYLTTNCEGRLTDPLKFWKDNQFKYKNLSLMARNFLAIPATSVSVEFVLSQANDLIYKKRNQLLPESVRTIMCLNQWSKKFKLINLC